MKEKHAHFIWKRPHHWVCSCCGTDYPFKDGINYCHSCGTKLDEPDDLTRTEFFERGNWLEADFGMIASLPYKCSQCGAHAHMASNFCPNCGAYMNEDL